MQQVLYTSSDLSYTGSSETGGCKLEKVAKGDHDIHMGMYTYDKEGTLHRLYMSVASV